MLMKKLYVEKSKVVTILGKLHDKALDLILKTCAKD